MKRLIILFSLLLLFAGVNGQVLRSSGNYVAPVSGSCSYDTDVCNYISGLSTPIVDSVLTRINTFVVALKDSLNITNLHDVFDVMYILANDNSEAALRNLTERNHDATSVSSMSFTRIEGFTGDGSADYLNTNFNPSSNGVNFIQNDASFGLYIRNAVTENKCDMGGGDGTSFISIDRFNNEIYFRLNYLEASFKYFTSTTQGFFINSRNGSNHYDYLCYKNKTSPTTFRTDDGVSQSPPNINIYIGAFNNNGTAIDFSTRQYSLFFMGKSITTTMRDQIVDCFEAYMDSLGKGIL